MLFVWWFDLFMLGLRSQSYSFKSGNGKVSIKLLSKLVLRSVAILYESLV
jgi:hypothetical protein